MKIFESNKLNVLKKAMDVYTRQHQAIAENISNANNEEFNRKNTDFSEELKKVNDRRLRVSDERHLPASPMPTDGRLDKDGGTVNLSEEMSTLADNQIRFDFGARILRKSFNGLKSAVAGRMVQ